MTNVLRFTPQHSSTNQHDVISIAQVALVHPHSRCSARKGCHTVYANNIPLLCVCLYVQILADINTPLQLSQGPVKSSAVWAEYACANRTRARASSGHSRIFVHISSSNSITVHGLGKVIHTVCTGFSGRGHSFIANNTMRLLVHEKGWHPIIIPPSTIAQRSIAIDRPRDRHLRNNGIIGWYTFSLPNIIVTIRQFIGRTTEIWVSLRLHLLCWLTFCLSTSS